MKIALVSPYSMDKPGGVAEHVAQLREEFLRLGHEVKVMAPRGSREGGLEVTPEGYGIGRTISIPGNGSKMRLTFDVTLYADVKKLMREEQFDVVHCHEPLQPVLPYMILLNSNAVNVATFHAYAEAQPWYSAFRPYMNFVLGRVDGRIAVSEPARELVSKYFEGDYRIIPNGIALQEYGSHVEPFPWANDDTPRILFVGRFEESRKGFKYLLRAFPLVKQQFPNVKLIVVGGGDPTRFESLIERLDIRDIEFKGFVSAEEKARYYASCDVMAVPSTGGESFGYTVVEPMAAGKPVVATSIAGYRSVMTNGVNGVMVPPRDPQAMALGLVRVLADGDLRQRIGAQGRIDAQQYDWSRVAAEVLDEYEQSAIRAKSARWRADFR